MRITVEVRWFGTGEVPRDLDAWFREPGSSFSWRPGGGHVRTDQYLLLRNPELGIKRRGDDQRAEIKGLVGPLRRECQFGRVDVFPRIYSKWTTAPLECSRAPLVQVKKTRWLRVISMAAEPLEIRLGAGELGEDPIEMSCLPEIGCGVELTRITLNGEDWWSFAAEAFAQRPPGGGSTIDLAAESLRTILSRLSGPSAVDFRGARYQDYTEWLDAHASRG